MTDKQQTEALQCAADLEYSIARHGMQDAFTLNAYRAMKMVRRQHARITDLEAQLEAIGAGGVSGPLIGQPQAMPDLSQLTERGAKAWAGVDAQGLREGGADMSKERDDLTAFYAWLHTYESEVGALDDGSARVGFIAGRASLQPPGLTAADMATAAADGFRSAAAMAAKLKGERKVLWNLLGECLPVIDALMQMPGDDDSDARLNGLAGRINDARTAVQAEELPGATP